VCRTDPVDEYDPLVPSLIIRAAARGARRVDAMVLADNAIGQQAWVASGYQSQPEWSRW